MHWVATTKTGRLLVSRVRPARMRSQYFATKASRSIGRERPVRRITSTASPLSPFHLRIWRNAERAEFTRLRITPMTLGESARRASRASAAHLDSNAASRNGSCFRQRYSSELVGLGGRVQRESEASPTVINVVKLRGGQALPEDLAWAFIRQVAFPELEMRPHWTACRCGAWRTCW